MTPAEFHKKFAQSIAKLKRSLLEKESLYYKEWKTLQPEQHLHITAQLILEKQNAPKQKH